MDMWQIMFYVYYVAMLGIVFGVVATSSQEGIWSCFVLTFNIIFAFIFGLNFAEPLAAFLADMVPEGAFYWDVVALMGVFTLFLYIGRTVTQTLSKHRVKFPDQLENVGKYAASFLPAFVLIGVVATAMQVAPLPKTLNANPLDPAGGNVLGDSNLLAPTMLSTMYWSAGPLSPISFDFEEPREYFNKDGKFISHYAGRRAYFGTDDAARKGMFISDK